MVSPLWPQALQGWAHPGLMFLWALQPTASASACPSLGIPSAQGWERSFFHCGRWMSKQDTCMPCAALSRFDISCCSRFPLF